MTLERGFRRIVKVLSLVALGTGVLFLMLLAGAGAWSVRLDKQREAQLVGEGCPADTEATRKSTPTTVTAVRQNRWRVMLPESGYTAIYVVNAQRELTQDEVLLAVRSVSAFSGSWERRRDPATGIEVLDCILESSAIARAQESAPSNRLIHWWMKQPVLFLPMAWVLLLPEPVTRQPWLIIAVALLSGLTLTGVATALPWGVFYLIRWIARGFTGGDEEGNR